MADVIIGLPGPWAHDYREEADHHTTKIGGLPDWPVNDLGIGSDMLNCRLCGESLCLVAQVYAPISMPHLNIGERVIYIFGCRMPKCGSNPRSWRAIRVQKCDIRKQMNGSSLNSITLEKGSSPISKSQYSYKEDLLSLEQDEESDSDVDLEELSQALSKATIQASQSRKNNISSHSNDALVSEPKSTAVDASKPVMPCFYIYSQTAQSHSDFSGYSSLSMKEYESHRKDHEDEKWEPENYEYDRALGADRTYLKFKKQLDLYPGQCFRYSFGGRPILATTDIVQPDNCSFCGSLRHYEMQLMSPLLYYLHEAQDSSSTNVPDEWSWMTLIVYACPNSCCPSSCKEKLGSCSWAVIEEAIVVQDECHGGKQETQDRRGRVVVLGLEHIGKLVLA